MKVYNISPQRSGTRSFASFCGAHGLRVAHWCGPEAEARAEAEVGYKRGDDMEARLWAAFDAYYASADVFADFPTPLVYRTPLRLDRTAKFIFIERDADAWIRSVRRHKARQPLTYLERLFYREITGRDANSLDEYGDGLLGDGYQRLNPLRHPFFGAFRMALSRLLVVNINDAEIGEIIAHFMGFKQQHPFPREGA